MKLASKVKHQHTFCIGKISVHSIIIDETQSVTIWAHTAYENEIYFFILALSLPQLNSILKNSGENGAEIEVKIAECLIEDCDYPLIIEAAPLDLENLVLKIYAASDMQEGLAGSAWNVFCLDEIFKKV